MGALDAVAGNVLDSPRLARRGATKIERSEKLMRAADLDAEANATVAQANSELKDARGAAAQATEDVHAEKAQETKQARDTAEARKLAARKATDQRADAAKKRADETAAQRKGAADAAKRVEHAVIRAGEKLAEADARAKLDEAQDNRSVAARRRCSPRREAATWFVPDSSKAAANSLIDARTKTVGGVVDARATRSEQPAYGDTRYQRHT